MTKAGNELSKQSHSSNSFALSRIPTLTRTVPFDAGITIRPVGERAFYVACFGESAFPASEFPWEADIPLSPDEVFNSVEECRQTWQEVAVNYKDMALGANANWNDPYVFQRQWDLKGRPDVLKVVGPKLAEAGAILFRKLFEQGNGELGRIASRLRQLSVRDSQYIHVHSNDFFVPWGLLYTHPDPEDRLKAGGGNYHPWGFWGYRHVIQHNTIRYNLDPGLSLNSDGRVDVSVNVDETIDTDQGKPYIHNQLDFFTTIPTLTCTVRTHKEQLREALDAYGNRDLADRIIYFCCHGMASDAMRSGVMLTDRELITASEIEIWRDKHCLASHPMVFINACHGGQMQTRFYSTIAKTLLEHHAAGIIGAHTDIPTVFAEEFARRFFTRFLAKERESSHTEVFGDEQAVEETHVRMGPLMRDLIREFMDMHHNPFGLVYSLYRGADCFVDW